MIRYPILLAWLLTAISASANDGSYYRVVLSEGGEFYEYRLSPHTFALSLASRCASGAPSICELFADPAYQADASKHKNMEEAVRLRSGKNSILARASADSQLRRAVVADYGLGKDQYKFEVHDLESGAAEMSTTTKRRIAAAEMLGTRGCVLLLTSSYRIGRMPWDLLFALAGHPPQYDTYYLEIYSADGRMLEQSVVKENLKDSAGYILPHLEDEPNQSFGPTGSC